MIVYDDPSCERRLPELITALRPPENVTTLDALRGSLVAAGQLEQAPEDAALPPDWNTGGPR